MKQIAFILPPDGFDTFVREFSEKIIARLQ
jgi:hypothetical protein